MEYATKQEYESLEKRVAKLEGSKSPKQKTMRKKSIKEFLMEKDVSSETDKTICLIYFLEKFRDTTEGVGSNELPAIFREAREKVPKNVSDVLQQCSKRGWISEAGKDGRTIKWQLTNTGEKYVEKIGGKST